MAAGKEKVLSLAFNQDHDRFICGLDSGFRIFNTVPEQLERHDLANGGVGQVEMLFKCNFVALVGGGKNPCFPTNKVMIWDDRKQKCVIELPFKSEVKGVRLRRDRIVVILETKTLVYTFTAEPQKIVSLSTCDNPDGLCEMCPDTENPLLILPGEQRGEVQIIDLLDVTKSGPVIPAHSNSLACFSLNRTGTMLATASEKGTLVRVFDTATGKQVHELRRGSSECKISCINFSPDSTNICASSDKKTVHIFNISETSATTQQSANSSAMKKYFSSTWSFAKFSVGAANSVCTFTADGKAVIVVCNDGTFYKGVFNAKGEVEMSMSNYLRALLDRNARGNFPL